MGSSSLSGPDYAHSNQEAETRDDAAGRWVAADESGWDGEQLYRRADPYLSIGSVAIDDTTAAPIVDQLRDDARLSQPPELKFAQFKSHSRLEVLAGLLGPDGPLAGRTRVYLVDKHYFVASKIIDLLLEEEAHARGINLYENDLARRAAWTLFTNGPRALGADGFDRVIATMVGFASARNRDGSVVSVDTLFEELRLAFARGAPLPRRHGLRGGPGWVIGRWHAPCPRPYPWALAGRASRRSSVAWVMPPGRQPAPGRPGPGPAPPVPEDSRHPHPAGILKWVSGTNQHYLPASVIDGFGRPTASGKLREARVAVRRKATGAVDSGFPKAETLAYRPGMYRLASPPAGIDPDVVDKLWDPVENGLRDLVGRLAARCLQHGDNQLLFAYAAGAGVRPPAFEAVAADHQARQGLAAPQGDDVQYARVLALHNQLPVLPTWRWRVLHSPADAPRFMITDRGWMYVGQEDWATHGLLLPMGPRVAILGYLDDPGLPPRRPAFEEHLQLCQSMIDYLNAAAWDDPYIDLLIAHPDDRNRLANLPDHQNLRINALGPFRNRKSVGLFD